MRVRTLALTTVAVIAASWLGGCAASAPDRADSATESMSTAGVRLDRGTKQIDAVLGALDGVVAAKGGDLRPSYKKFVDEVAKTESAAEAARNAADGMRAKAAEHFEAWANEAQTINDPSLKEANLARRTTARATFAKVQGAYDQGKQAYDPFMSKLQDLSTFLGADLTSHGVDAAAPMIQRTKADGAKLKESVNTIQQAIEKVRSELVSPTAPAK